MDRSIGFEPKSDQSKRNRSISKDKGHPWPGAEKASQARADKVSPTGAEKISLTEVEKPPCPGSRSPS